MGRVIRPGTVPLVKDLARHRHGKRTCASAPATPANPVQSFHRRRTLGNKLWYRMNTRWDLVTADVAGRPISVERYQVQMRATDASGEGVETNLQAEEASFTGAEMTVNAGSAAATNYYRELNASPDEIKKTLTGLTAGITAQVKFFAMKDLAGSAPRIKCQIWNVTNSVEVTSKNQVVDTLNSRLHMALTFTPVAGKTYEARVSWVSGTGIARFTHVKYHDKGEAAIWRALMIADELADVGYPHFADIPHPKTWYYQFRVRALNRIHGAPCWSAWTAWTTPTNPVTGEPIGPPAPDGITLTFDKVEGSRRRPWRARTLWNESPGWLPPDDDFHDTVDRYGVQLQTSNDGGTTIANTRTVSRPAKDEDADTTARLTWFNIRRVRSYRTRVRAVDDGRRGAWSAWTSWASPAASFTTTVQNLTVTNPNASTYRAKWDEPADPSDVDRYKVVWRRKNADTTLTIMDTSYTLGTRSTYHVPLADRDRPHRCKVTPVLEELHTDTDSAAGSYQAEAIATDTDTADVNNAALTTGSFVNAPTTALGTTTVTHWEMDSSVANEIRSYIATMDNIGYIVSDANLIDISTPYDTGQGGAQLSLISAASGSNNIYLGAIGGDINIDAADTRLVNHQMRGFCAVQAYNDNGAARNFGHGVMWGGVARADNVPSSITFTLAGTDTNVTTPSANDITLRGFRFAMTVNANAGGNGSRSFVTVGN